MTAVQLPLDADSGLPQAFVDRWRELGGPALSGESCTRERGRWTFIVRLAGLGRVAFVRRVDVAKAADELFARCAT